MGNAASSATKQRLQESFYRKCQGHHYEDEHNERKHLNIRDVLDLSDIVKDSYRVDPTHIGVLYALDRNKDGKYDLQEVLEFVDMASNHCRFYHERDHGVMVQGYCSLLMWKALSGPDGKQQFAQWVRRLFAEDLRTYEYASHPGVVYIRAKDIDTLYTMFDIKRCQGLDSAQFIELMQESAAEEGLLELDEPQQEDKLPLQAIEGFAEAMFEGIASMMDAFLDGADMEEVLRLPSPHPTAAAS